jgi:myo-inositol-1-phosphate synthase
MVNIDKTEKTVLLDPSGRASQALIKSPFVVEANSDSRITRHVQNKPIVFKRENKIEIEVKPAESFLIKTDLQKPKKLGLMLVGWGGNNGSTLTASLLAHRHELSWESRRGVHHPNFLGSLIMASCAHVGATPQGEDVHLPLFQLAPFIHPNDIVISGWDINDMNLYDAMDRSQVLEPGLKAALKPHMKNMVPLPSYYDPSFIASNQSDRANNLISGSKSEVIEKIRKDIANFKKSVDKVVVLWTANTERYTKIDPKVHLKSKDLLKAIEEDHSEISPSSIFAIASILEGCLFINGSPQNTFIPAVVEFAQEHGIPIAGDDFKSGQTKFKSVLVDFLVSSGIKPLSIVSYNHLGNNDGKNLNEAAQFKSKEISKSSVCDDIFASNPVMFPYKQGRDEVDHTIIIEYIPAVGDSKRAMDEYECEIFMGGRQTFSIHNVCEDSLLAAPLMLDLVLLGELLTRVQVQKEGGESWSSLGPCLSLMSFMLKAPLVPKHAPVINALNKQRRAIESLLKTISGLPIIDDLELASRFC